MQVVVVGASGLTKPLPALCGAHDFNRLCNHRHSSRAAPLERSARSHAENLAGHGPQSGCTRDPRGPMSVYLALKYMHVIGAAVLLGPELGQHFSCCRPISAATQPWSPASLASLSSPILYSPPPPSLAANNRSAPDASVGYSLWEGLDLWSSCCTS